MMNIRMNYSLYLHLRNIFTYLLPISITTTAIINAHNAYNTKLFPALTLVPPPTVALILTLQMDQQLLLEVLVIPLRSEYALMSH